MRRTLSAAAALAPAAAQSIVVTNYRTPQTAGSAAGHGIP